jgi:hypothetical protein
MNRLLKTASYLAAPKLTYAARHPRKAALLKAGTWATSRVMPGRRKRRSRTGLAMKGLGAAAVAIPLGIWMGRRMRAQPEMQQMN